MSYQGTDSHNIHLNKLLRYFFPNVFGTYISIKTHQALFKQIIKETVGTHTKEFLLFVTEAQNW